MWDETVFSMVLIWKRVVAKFQAVKGVYSREKRRKGLPKDRIGNVDTLGQLFCGSPTYHDFS